MFRRASLPVAAALLLATPGSARAGPPAGLETGITWSAPPECPGEAAFRAEVERLLGRPLGHSGDVVRVVSEVTRVDGAAARYALRIRISHGRGWVNERRLSGESCERVLEAAAVVLSLALGADAGPPEATPPPIAPPMPPPPLPNDEPAPAPEVRASAPAWDVAAIGGVDFRSLPAPAAGLGLAVGWTRGAHRVELRAAAWLPRSTPLSGQPPVGGDVSLYAAAVRYCHWLLGGSLALAPCGGVEGGAVLASATGAVERAPAGVGRWLAPQIGLLGAFRPAPARSPRRRSRAAQRRS